MNTATKVIAVVLFLLALVLGVLAITLARRSPPPPPVPVAQSSADPATAAPAVPTVPVVVAARDLPAGHELAADDLRIAQWRSAPGAGYDSPQALVGKVTRFEVGVEEPVLATHLASGLSTRLQAGERAVAIAVDDVMGVANRLQPGDWVDVFFTLPRLGADAQRNQSRLLLPRLRVLAYGHESVDGPDAPAGGSRSGGPPPARTAVLAVPVAAVNELLLASGNGKLQLALRSPKDEIAPATELFPEPARVLAARGNLTAEQRAVLDEPANVAYAGMDLPALSGPLPPPPAPAPRPRAAGTGGGSTIEIVRGTQTTQEAFR